MFCFLFYLSRSYRICPEKIPSKDDLYFDKNIKAEHWTYFTIKLNESQIGVRVNLSTTGNASFYVGTNGHCPYKEEKPFFRGGNVKNKMFTIWKYSTLSFPIGIYADEETSVTMSFSPIKFEIPDLRKYVWKAFAAVAIVFTVCGYLYDHIPFSSLKFWKRKDKRRRRNKKY